MIRFTPKELDTILGDFLGKPWRRYAAGPDAYDCYGLVKAFLDRVGVQIAAIGQVDPTDSRDPTRAWRARPPAIIVAADARL